MELREVQKMALEMIDKYIPGCEFSGFYSSKKALGRAWVKGYRQGIEISKQFATIANETQVREALAHECAHILSFRKYGTLAHDRYFYSTCLITGANQERVNKDDNISQALKGDYRMVVVDEGKVKELCSGSWHRRPRKDLTDCFINNRREATLNKIFYCRAEHAVVGKKADSINFWRK